MELKSIPFVIKFKNPFINSNIKISSRQGFIIEMTDEIGNKGFGEIAPLPGSSVESYESIIPIITELEKSIIGSELNSDVFKNLSSYPSVEFGISQALHSIFIIRNGLNPEWRFNSNILINGIVGILPKTEAMNTVEKLTQSGFRTIKIKVGRKNIDDDISLIKTIAENINSNIQYRLDVNGKWDIDKTMFAVKYLEEFNIEYIEQPVNSFEDLAKLAEISKIAIAADESIRNTNDVKNMLANSNIQFFVLKPSLLGSITKSIDLIELIETENRKVIISSAFESSVGRSTLVFLSSLVKSDSAHGLGVAEYFISDITKDPYPIAEGKINFNQDMYPPKFNFDK